MLRVGLTGDLGSGKSTVARLLGEHGAVVMASDDIARAMMEPGEPVYRAIVEHFGDAIVGPDGRLDRKELARLAFDPRQPRVEELNAIVHPAVIAEQERRLARLQQERPEAIVVVESALVFSAKLLVGQGLSAEEEPAPWWQRFDCIVVVTAPIEVKIARYVERLAQGGAASSEERERWENDAASRLRVQAEAAVPRSESILMLNNGGSREELAMRVEALWDELLRRAAAVSG